MSSMEMPSTGMTSGMYPANPADMSALISVIKSTVMPETWQSEFGGSGTIEPYFGGLIVINNNPQVHRKVEKLLQMLRAASKQRPGAVVREP
jgi:hypothetical protein